jgi:nicotinate phosphoribosyltransferase
VISGDSSLQAQRENSTLADSLQRSALLTDLYQLTMLAAYHAHGMEETAAFEFFVRKLPRRRNFLVAAGLDQVLEFLENLRFGEAELDWLRQTGRFGEDFIDFLSGLRFTGSVEAMPEGIVFFADEPILRVVAPLPQAQLFESRIINLLHFETLIASKAARCVLAAPGKLLVDFGMRRAHGAEAGLLAARASYLAGFDGTATVLAGKRFGIPVFGTMAHSFVQAHDDESLAFEHFAETHPDHVILLIDTYDTLAAARKVAELAPRLAARGINVKGVRLDSGDLLELSHEVRRILDQAGLKQITLFASGSLDEDELLRLIASGAPIDGFGIGTHLDTSSDQPYLDCAYKLEEYGGKPRRKRSAGKATWPGRKQVFRQIGADGQLAHDILTIEGDSQPGIPLLRPVMRDGRRLFPPEPLATVRERALAEINRLPEALRALEPATEPYTVQIAPALRKLTETLDAGGGE